MTLIELIEWHSEQVSELRREGSEWVEFHADAVELLNNLNSSLSSIARVVK